MRFIRQRCGCCYRDVFWKTNSLLNTNWFIPSRFVAIAGLQSRLNIEWGQQKLVSTVNSQLRRDFPLRHVDIRQQLAPGQCGGTENNLKQMISYYWSGCWILLIPAAAFPSLPLGAAFLSTSFSFPSTSYFGKHWSNAIPPPLPWRLLSVSLWVDSIINRIQGVSLYHSLLWQQVKY